MSDPNRFDERNYKFFVRVDSIPINQMLSGENYKTRVDQASQFLNTYAEDPALQMASGSLISNEHNQIFESGDYALILSVPPENIIATSPRDTGKLTYARRDNGPSTLFSNSVFIERFKRHGVESPSELMKKTVQEKNSRDDYEQSRHYNEILFTSKIDLSKHFHEEFITEDRQVAKVRVIGIAIYNRGDSWNHNKINLYKFLYDVASQTRIPIVRFGFQEDEFPPLPAQHPDGIIHKKVHRNGYL